MLIYHKTKGTVFCTQVVLGAGSNSVSHGTHVWEKHQSAVDKLHDNGDVWVTGGTYASAVYSGKLEPRKSFLHYLDM